MIESRNGWIRPERTRTLPELKTLIAQKRAELEALEREALELVELGKLEAIVQVRNIMRAQQISLAEVLG